MSVPNTTNLKKSKIRDNDILKKARERVINYKRKKEKIFLASYYTFILVSYWLENRLGEQLNRKMAIIHGEKRK